MNSLRRFLFGLAALTVVLLPAASAQDFGKNKITYQQFKWAIYRSPHFDIHYYQEEAPQLEAVVSEAESAYLDLSRRLDHDIKERIPLVIYRTHIEFEQTNVLMEEIPEAVGGFSEPFQNRIVVPIDEPTDKRYKLIRHELVHIFEFDIFYAGSLRRTINAAPPEWLMEGLASYLADDEDSFDQMVIRDAVLNNLVPSLKQLTNFSFLTYRYGNAIFDFIETRYGAQGMRNFLFEFRKTLLSPNPEKAFQDAFGLSVDSFDRQFARFLRQRYLPVLTEKRAPEDYGKEIGLTRPGQFTFSPALSPSGDLIAALATPGLEIDVVIISAKDGKIIRNLTPGFTNRFSDVVTEAFSGKRDLGWSPDGDTLAFFVKKENFRQLMVFAVQTGKLELKVPFKDIAACASPAFSPDGKSIVFAGNRDGAWDIFLFDLASQKITNLTQDEYYDSNPAFSPDGKSVLYNRRIGAFEKAFEVALDSPERKTQLTAGPASDIQPVYSKDGKWLYFSSDRGTYGVFNLHRMELASGRIERLTDLAGGAFTPAEMSPAEDGSPQLVFSGFYSGTFRLFRMKLSGPEVNRAIKTGNEEPLTSPLAPSRREEQQAAKRARMEAERKETGPGKPAAPPTTTAAPQPEKPAPEGADSDLKPFRPPLQLGLDEKRKEPYKVKWNVDAPQITLGVTNDGSLLSNVSLIFSDILGDNRVAVQAYSISDYSNIQLTYLNQKRRLDWGAQFFDYRDYYLSGTYGISSQRTQRANRYTSLSGFASYPFNRFYRAEAGIGYVQRRSAFPFWDQSDPNHPVLSFQDYAEDYPVADLALVGDTTRFQEWGPYQGHRFRLQISAFRISNGPEKGQTVKTTTLDFRGYQRVTARSLFAFHANAVLQNGSRAPIYSLGGINELRGYDYREFFGTNILNASIEFRFPLINALQWGYGGIMGPFRGFVFADFGTAWLADYLLYDETGHLVTKKKVTFDRNLFGGAGGLREYKTKGDDGRWIDLHGSAGLGFSVPILGLPCTWSFAKIFDGKTFGSYSSSFYIVYEF